VIWWRRRDRAVYVTAKWLEEQARRELKKGIDGVTIKFPIRKLANESSRWNAATLKRRA
jgi:hypothetical protein